MAATHESRTVPVCQMLPGNKTQDTSCPVWFDPVSLNSPRSKVLVAGLILRSGCNTGGVLAATRTGAAPADESGGALRCS